MENHYWIEGRRTKNLRSMNKYAKEDEKDQEESINLLTDVALYYFYFKESGME